MPEIVLRTDIPEKAVAVLKEAIELEKNRIIYGLQLTRNRLKKFERKYKVSSERFIHEWSSEDLKGGDLEYVEWAGEYQVSLNLNDRLNTLKVLNMPLLDYLNEFRRAVEKLDNYGFAESFEIREEQLSRRHCLRYLR